MSTFFQVGDLISIFQVIAILFSKLIHVDTFIPNFSVQLFDGGVSHIVAAALETKGLIDQGKILKNLTVLNELAGLFYLFAIAMAIGAVAVFGTYRQGLYFLIGPAIYTFMVTTTVPTNGVKAIVGEFEIPNSISRESRFLNRIKAISPEEGGTANISLFFAVFDGITSEVMQKINSVLLDTKNREHLKIEGRERVLNYLMMTYPSSGTIPQMIARHHGECSHVMQEYYSAGKDKKQDVFARKRNQADVEKDKALADKNWGQAKISLGSSDIEIKRFLIAMQGSPDFPQNVGITDEKEDLILTCNQLWGIIAATLKQVANKALDPSFYKGSLEKDEYEPKKQEYDDTKDFLTSAFNGADASDVLGAQIYKNVLNQTTHSALNSQLFSNSPFNSKEFHQAYQELPGADARGAFVSLRYFATSIPYIQGLLLYLLSIAFPFFAVLLVIPGKAVSFFMWCSLWVWVKSWDVGFALVLVIRDVLWHMLKHRVNTFSNTLDLKDPFSVYGVILNNDALATMNTYWEMSFALTLVVPFLTAHFCLGATNMFEMFRSGIDQTVGRFKQFETNSSRRAIANHIEGALADDRFRLQAAMAQYQLESEPQNTERYKGGGMINPRGAQTIYGEKISKDRIGYSYDFKNSTQGFANASNAQANFTFGLAGAFSQVGTPEFLDGVKGQVRRIDEIESRVADRLGSNVKGVYRPPKEFKGMNDIDSLVPKEVIDRETAAYEKKMQAEPSQNRPQLEKEQFDPNRSYTWGEFLEQKAVQNGEQLRIPSLMRGMPDLDATVDKKYIDKIFKDEHHPLRERAAAAEVKGENANITWSEVIVASHDHQRDQFSYLAATVGRKYMPATQLVSDVFASAQVLGESISMKAAPAVSGAEQINSIPGMAHLFNSVIKSTQDKPTNIDPFSIEKPGLDAKAGLQGDAVTRPPVDPNAKTGA